MLVLSRRERERVRLGESIVVTVVRVSGDKVRLGIEAPADVLVLRDELDPQAPVEVEVEVAPSATLGSTPDRKPGNAVEAAATQSAATQSAAPLVSIAK